MYMLGLTKPVARSRRKHSLTHSLRNTRGFQNSFSLAPFLSCTLHLEQKQFHCNTGCLEAVKDSKALIDKWKLTLHISVGNAVAQKVLKMDNMYGEYLIFLSVRFSIFLHVPVCCSRFGWNLGSWTYRNMPWQAHDTCVWTPFSSREKQCVKEALFMWYTNHCLTASLLVHKETIRDGDEPCYSAFTKHNSNY